jgi:hypothetical protein
MLNDEFKTNDFMNVETTIVFTADTACSAKYCQLISIDDVST